MQRFLPGQRWASDTEPELGLGTILTLDGRRLTVIFPASDETRIYAAASPPLTRAVFKPGETITTNTGKSMIVETVTETEGLFTYSGDGPDIPETLLSDTPPCLRPQDRLLQGTIDTPDIFALRHDTWLHRARVHKSGVHGFNGARIDLLPHQLYIAAQATNRMATRILLADEVGLGKTIEACLILHRLLLTGRVTRVLIMVPEALVHQWFVELLRRFNLTVSIFDEERCFAAEPSSPDNNPFLDEQIILAATSLFDQQDRRLAQAHQADWDLLIIDEAHHLKWSPESPSKLYTFVEALTSKTPNVLLLTATPEGLGPESHFARLRLLDPERYPSFKTFQEEAAQHIATAREADTLIAAGKPISDLLDRYGPGRVMFRNSRKNIAGFPARKPHFYPLPSEDDRCSWLAEFLRGMPKEKVLLICTDRKQVHQLAGELPHHLNIETALFHEDMTILQRDRSAAWFSEDDGARLLLCSEIGGEGRNFQFAHHMVLYDLPENPEVIEQRIGRLDRIGQREIIHIHVPYLSDSPEENRMRWLREGLEAFTYCLKGGSELYRVFRDELGGDIDDLVARTQRYKKDLYERLDQGTNRLLEMHSFDREASALTVNAVSDLDADPAFEPYLLRLFDFYGIHAEEIAADSYQLMPSHTFKDGLPGFNKEGMAITLDRRMALDREDWTFMTWDHPLVTAAMDQLLGSKEGSGTICEQSSAGTTFLTEAIFILDVTAPPALEADRFLSPTPLRVTIDMTLQTSENADLQLPDGRRSGLLDAGDAVTQRINEMLEAARDTAEIEAAERRSKARSNMHAALESELGRLKHLAEVNDHVHQEELLALAERITQLDTCIEESTLRLDAIRLIVA